jgi:hypothetical protein
VYTITYLTHYELRSHMLERDEAARRRLDKAHIADSVLTVSITLFNDLPRFLNGTRTSDGKRVVRILEGMLELERLSSPVSGVVWPPMELKRTDPERFKALCEIQDKNVAITRELAKFKFVPNAEVVVGGGGGPSEWSALWRWSNKKLEEHLRMDAAEALQVILKLTQIGDLTRLRHCAQCQKWLYARFRHQVFCSTTCQQKNYTKCEQFKAHRRRYMRDRYQKLVKNPFGRRKRVVNQKTRSR